MTVKDVKQLIQYWLDGSDYDWKTSLSLLKAKKYPYCLFMCHLSVEKLLKGLIVKEEKDHAPMTHNLTFLAGKLDIEFSKERIQLLQEMNDFNIEARYPDEQNEFYKKATKEFARRYVSKTKELREWLVEKF